MSYQLQMAVMWYGVSMLPRLRGMSRKERQAMLLEASDQAQRVPIHMHREPDLPVPLWSDEPLTGGQVTALLLFGLWIECDENELLARPLIEAWPCIRNTLTLCDQGGEKRVAPYTPPAASTASPEEPATSFPLFALLDTTLQQLNQPST